MGATHALQVCPAWRPPHVAPRALIERTGSSLTPLFLGRLRAQPQRRARRSEGHRNHEVAGRTQAARGGACMEHSKSIDTSESLTCPPTQVVGGGPSGACAAETLAKAGIETFLIERKMDNCKPCGGAIPLCMIDEFDLPMEIIDRKVRPAARALQGRRRADALCTGDEDEDDLPLQPRG